MSPSEQTPQSSHGVSQSSHNVSQSSHGVAWSDDLLDRLSIRDAYEQRDSKYYKAFHDLSQLAVNSANVQGNYNKGSASDDDDDSDGSNPPSPSLLVEKKQQQQQEKDSSAEQMSTFLVKENAALKHENEALIQSLNQSTINLEKNEIERKRLNKHSQQLQTKLDKLNRKLDHLKLELQEKNKSIEIINDDNLINQIQNNVLNDRVAALTKENEALLARWMDKVKSDAEKMNDANQFLEMARNKND